LARRFPQSTLREPHFAQTFAAAWVDPAPRLEELLKIASDPKQAAIVSQIAHRCAHHTDFATGATADFFCIAAQHGKRAATDRSQAQQANIDGFH
jgi:hypothetical protein